MTVPPKRGRVKAQIFESMAGSVSFAATKAIGILSKITSNGSDSTSAPASPTPKACDSDDSGDQI